MASSSIVRLKASMAARRAREAGYSSRASGKLAAAAGGALGAALYKYVPAVVPGTAADNAAVALVVFALDAYAVSSRSSTVNSMAEGLTGYVVGQQVESILP